MAKYEYQSTMLWHDNDDVNACLQKDEEEGWEIMQMTALPVQVGDDLDYDEPHILLLMRREAAPLVDKMGEDIGS